MNRIARAGIIAAIYIILVFVFQAISFGPIQFRVAEALTLLPMVYPEAIGGLYVGALLSNILGGQGPWDIFGGSFVTLLAAYLTYRYKGRFIGDECFSGQLVPLVYLGCTGLLAPCP